MFFYTKNKEKEAKRNEINFLKNYFVTVSFIFGGGLFLEQIADFGNVLHLAYRRGGKIKLRGEHEPGPYKMAVPIDETGQHGPAP